MSNLIGQTIGQYEIIKLIGQGGMANVYLARQKSIGREVAFKVLPTHFLQDPTFLERFNREVQVIARLEHPRILPVYDFGEEDGLPYIVMRYINGGSLADAIKKSANGFSLEEASRMVTQIAEGLDFAHERGIIHRDFKPSNVLLDGSHNTYLADFGIAKATEATVQLTGSGIIGTPSYMAPEMVQEHSTTSLIDVYALGITLYQMLSGELPFKADTPMGTALAHLTQPTPDVRDLRADMPDKVQRVIERGMAKDPAQRYQTAKALADDLKAAIGGKPLSSELPVQRPDPFTVAVPQPPGGEAASRKPTAQGIAPAMDPTPAGVNTNPMRPAAAQVAVSPVPPVVKKTGQNDWAAYLSFAIGLISVCAWLLPIIGCPVSIVGIIFALIAIKSDKKVFLYIGLVLSILSLLASIGKAILGMLMQM